MEAKENLPELSEDSSEFLDFGSELNAELMQEGLIGQSTQAALLPHSLNDNGNSLDSRHVVQKKTGLYQMSEVASQRADHLLKELQKTQESEDYELLPVVEETQPNLENLIRELSPLAKRFPEEVENRHQITPSKISHSDLSQNQNLSELGVIQIESQPERISLKNVKPAQSVLSGSEFIHTLSSLRDGGGSLNSIRSDASRDFSSQDEDPESKSEFGDRLQQSIQGMNPSTLKEGSDFKIIGSPNSEVTGHVVKNAIAKEKLSSESVIGITQGIHAISSRGEGEMRVRLRPDHLGELNIHVSAQGNRVALKIQASSEESKKILEESLGQLKERLATQQLSLNQVDFTVAPVIEGLKEPTHQNPTYQDSSQSSSTGQYFPGSGGFGNQGRGEGWRQNSQDAPDALNRLSSREYPGLGRSSASTVSAGRIDIRA